MTAPCKGCESRVVGCHGGCEKYIVYKAEMEKAAQRRAEEKIALDEKLRVVYKILKSSKWKK